MYTVVLFYVYSVTFLNILPSLQQASLFLTPNKTSEDIKHHMHIQIANHQTA